MSDGQPTFVDAILCWPATWFVARLALVSAYLIGGVTKLGDWPSAIAEQVHFGVHPPEITAALTIFIEVVGSALLLSGRLVWLAAGALGIFTLLTAFIASPFWAMQGQARFIAINDFFEHLGLVAAFVMAAMIAGKRHARA
ncbi:hypothetical protein AWL63_15535 [Sphingomonas panacis]|uniref:DoxX family protein n=1 Tax=Sphingomonas panacis TaxID=1560345 RepID=A0A1B3ZCM6_9SPHN|nr:DoxX family protein [Sphingomonas panacis]AOH85160.1 hypothetical protein AWL63_15535 [Sphingomonas panacis]